ncbi:ATP-binding protein [Nonomuraea deserti]|uniref:ATP-binding protein n=1 Tax=Nonomuraea deserti TaxID=1848322 RepID=UPI001FEB2416|nr:LuxR C-terminal-related transcriptional regulator [Nonomuraea deserti]
MTTTISKGRPVSRLPVEVTSFVGRRREVAEVRRVLGAARVVTLTGVGGVGKSRLALRVAAEARPAFRDGVFLVELAGLESPQLLPRALVSALEIRDQSARPPMDTLIERLLDQQILVVLDNCEHLLDECALVAQTMVRSIAGLRILATSRQALGIAGEQVLTVPTLSLPEPDPSGPRAGSVSTHPDAVRLFADRAMAVLPGFTVTESNREVIERICRHLDGIPLGIELAAVRLRSLSIEQLMARLDNRFQLLTAGKRTAMPRQQTLRALIDWSHSLCTEKEQLLWARASVFAGGLDLEAAEAVCSGDGIDRDEVIDLVAGLIDKSVLVRDDRSPAVPTVRYRLLETIRQYGRERLAAMGQEAALRRRHRDYFRGLAAGYRANVFGPSLVTWSARLRAHHANLRRALEYCFADPQEAPTGLAMAADLFHQWAAGAYLGEGCEWLDRGLAAAPEPDEVYARALWSRAWLAIIQADVDSAETMLREAGAIGARLGDESVQAYAALCSGMIRMYRGDPEPAVTCYERAGALHRAVGDHMGLALSLVWTCLARSLRGDSARALSAGERCIALCDTHGERWVRSYAHMALGVESCRHGDTRRAAAYAKESLRFQRTIDDLLGVRFNMEVLVWIAASEGRHERAAVLLGALRTVRRMIDVMPLEYVYVLRHYDDSEARIREALDEAKFEEAVRRGSRLSYDEALAYALEEHASRAGRTASAQPLTRREMEIARLVARGMSNKEIAATLVIAQRTAEGHVEHILTKLGFTSRTQIAVWVTDQER